MNTPHAQDYFSAPPLTSGIPKGVIIELLGPSSTEWLVQFLTTHKHLKIFWAEREDSVQPTALHQGGLNLNRITFGTMGADLNQPLQRVLQNPQYQVIIAPHRFYEIQSLKTLQLHAEKSHSLIFLMSQKKSSFAQPIYLQLEIHKDHENQFHVEVLMQKNKLGDA